MTGADIAAMLNIASMAAIKERIAAGGKGKPRLRMALKNAAKDQEEIQSRQH